MMMAILALIVISLGALNTSVASSAVGVDWGNRVVPACPPDVKDCKVGVDWGNMVVPACPPGVKNCNVAVDWGNSFSPEILDEPPVDALAVDWGNARTCDPKDPKCKPAPCNPTIDRKCQPGNTQMVDWGS